MIRKGLKLAAAFAAVAAAAAVCVVAAAFALYALARMWLSAAGAAAVVAGVFALVALVVAWLATRKVTPKPTKAAEPPIVERLIHLAQERPLVALGAMAAAVTVLVRNPAVITAIVSAVLAGTAAKPEK